MTTSDDAPTVRDLHLAHVASIDPADLWGECEVRLWRDRDVTPAQQMAQP